MCVCVGRGEGGRLFEWCVNDTRAHLMADRLAEMITTFSARGL